jgi:hypothetical protein
MFAIAQCEHINLDCQKVLIKCASFISYIGHDIHFDH